MKGVRERGSDRTNLSRATRFRQDGAERRHHTLRHCERSEANPDCHPGTTLDCFVAALLAMTAASIRREAIQQPVAAGALQVGLRAAAIRAARGMRAVPRFRRLVIAQALTIGMAHD